MSVRGVDPLTARERGDRYGTKSTDPDPVLLTDAAHLVPLDRLDAVVAAAVRELLTG